MFEIRRSSDNRVDAQPEIKQLPIRTLINNLDIFTPYTERETNEIVIYLSRGYPMLQLEDEDGRTVLSICVELQKDISQIQALIKAGADPFLPDNLKKIPLDYDEKHLQSYLILEMIKKAEEQSDFKLYQTVKERYINSYFKPKDFSALAKNYPKIIIDILDSFKIDSNIVNTLSNYSTMLDDFLRIQIRIKDHLIILKKFLILNADFTVKWSVPEDKEVQKLLAN